jgi:hypothetical protein
MTTEIMGLQGIERRARAICQFIARQGWSDDQSLKAMAYATPIVINKKYPGDEDAEDRDLTVAGCWCIIDAFTAEVGR